MYLVDEETPHAALGCLLIVICVICFFIRLYGNAVLLIQLD